MEKTSFNLTKKKLKSLKDNLKICNKEYLEMLAWRN